MITHNLSALFQNTLFFKNEQFQYVFDIFLAFGKIAGCRLNLDISEAFHIGSTISQNDHSPMFAHLGLNCSQHTVNYLGVTIPIKPKRNSKYFD